MGNRASRATVYYLPPLWTAAPYYGGNSYGYGGYGGLGGLGGLGGVGGLGGLGRIGTAIPGYLLMPPRAR
ncbi:unnamed protein product [Rotaria sordida]|uniref:Uncharacterized protein n=1 Tax=Rotaria sordida TaxID=392033 RepID=A0A819K3K7_9BILA|nr:unnamed protein product [Rotaria sordida]